jgi:acetylornithine deacetylase/succinyl-diaminopimelate desuccinylase family protein
MVSHDERELLAESTEALKDETLGFLQELIRTDSVNPPGDYSNIHELITSRYDDLGWKHETVWASEEVLEEHELEYPRPNVMTYPAEGDDLTIALVAHIDVVPVDPDAWDHDPFAAEIEDGYVYGRGAKDCKGRLATYTLAARTLEESGLMPENASVVVAGTADEEIGSAAGAKYVTESGALTPDYAVIEGNIDRIWNAGAGILRFSVNVRGEASHAGMAPEEGANAILSGARILTALEEYSENVSNRTSEIPGIPGPTCVPATIEGGVKSNVVPSKCSFSVDLRIPPDYDMDDVEQEFRDIIHDVDLLPGTNVELDCFRLSEPYYFDPDAPHITAIKNNAEAILNTDVPVEGIRGSTDARYFSKVGAECVNYGPGDDDSNIHAANENISIQQILDAGQILAASIVDIARSHE